MGTSKILIDGVGIDLTQDTVAANKMLSGIKAHDSNGDSVTGSILTYTGTQASGTKSITANGTFDVTEFASADVNVPVPNCKVFNLTFPEDIATTTTIVSGDSTVAAHWADNNATAILELLDQPEDVQSISVIFATNRKIANASYYQMRMQNASGTGFSTAVGGTAMKSTASENHRLQSNANGDIIARISGRPLKAGNWRLTFLW